MKLKLLMHHKAINFLAIESKMLYVKDDNDTIVSLRFVDK